MGSIEKFFLLNLFRISFAGVTVVLVSDLVYAKDTLSITTDLVILSACIIAFIVKRWSFNASVLIVTGITLLAISYHWLVKVDTMTSIAIILLLGFVFSTLLRGKLMWAMHGITSLSIIFILYAQVKFPFVVPPHTVSKQVTIGITFFVLYFIISYSSGILKLRYDEVNRALQGANEELQLRASEIEAKNQALQASHEDVNELNKKLEGLVTERTAKVHAQNEILLKYTYTNAHHLRGPIARLLGLISIHKLEPNPDHHFFMSKIEDQANEIDNVVKQINTELEKEGREESGRREARKS